MSGPGPRAGRGTGSHALSGAWDLTSPLHLWAGESGLGKSTLVHSLFLTDLYKERKLLSAEGEWAPRPLLGDPFKGSFQVQPRSSVPEAWVQTTTRPRNLGVSGVPGGRSQGRRGHSKPPPTPPAPERISQTVEILKHTVDIEEKGVKLKLTIVDTPGFGDAVNNSEW